MRSDDFYMVLPSNSSPEAHPNNTAGDFIINWENPVELDPDANWHVALTEVNYIYNPSTISTNYGIRYTAVYLDQRYHVHQKVYCDPRAPNVLQHEVIDDIKRDYSHRGQNMAVIPYSDDSPPDEDGGLSIIYDAWIPKLRRNPTKDNEMMFACKRAFSLSLNDADLERLKLGPKHSTITATQRFDDWWYIPAEITCEQCIKELRKSEIRYISQVEKYDLLDLDFTFEKDRYFQTIEDFVKYLSENCTVVFDSVTYNEYEKRISLALKPRICEIEFNGGLHFALGSTKSQFRVTDVEVLKNDNYNPPLTTIVSKQPPQLDRGIMNMYIYASICQPIYVGHTLVPLLKNVFVDSSDDDKRVGHARNSIVYNPMYIPVASTSFNSIEINIRNDAGKIITFPHGAISVLTVHFKKM